MASKPPTVRPSSLRLLILSPSPSDSKSIPPFRPFLEEITGSKPSDEITSFAGYTSHPPLQLRTKYYNADTSIWCDELPSKSNVPDMGPAALSHGCAGPAEESQSVESTSSPPTLEEWEDQMLSPEAREVRAVIGAMILLLPISSTQLSSILPLPGSHTTLIQTAHALREAIEDENYGRDIASLVVLQPTSPNAQKDDAKLNAMMERFEEVILSERALLGWDFVAWDAQIPERREGDGEDGDDRNEFGEKTGIKRVIEVLEGVDWSASPNLGEDEDGDDHFNTEDLDVEGKDGMPNILGTGSFSGLDYELQREMMELKMSMQGEDGDDSEEEREPHERKDEDSQVEQLPGLIDRVVAIREVGSEMPKAEREKFARREIGRIMKEMG